MSRELFTIGHSTHPLDRFLSLLARCRIEVLADIRRFPGSRGFPHFNQGNLSSTLPEAGIEYCWLEALGGRRRTTSSDSSKNVGLRNESFRNYADYMLTAEFSGGVKKLLALATERPTAFMCSEGVFWRCHRRLVSDYLLVNGFSVQHIMPSGELRLHTLTEGARVEEGELIYSPPGTERNRLLFE